MPFKLNLQNFYQGKRVLVTGGAGFIGSNLVDKLVSLGAKVTVIENFATGAMQNLSTSLANIKLIIGDIQKENVCEKALHAQEIIFHTAAMTSVSECQAKAEQCLQNNVASTKNLLKRCPAESTFVFSSSAAVYGTANKRCTENQALQPASVYGTSKVAGEELCQKYAKQNSLKCIVLRYFNVYGPRQENNPLNSSVITKFKKGLVAGSNLTIFGDGTQTRDFVHVTKVVEANLLTAAYPRGEFEVFNVASGKSISLLELIAQLERQLGLARTEIRFEPMRAGDITKSEASCEKYQRFLQALNNDEYL
jgi:UDP-glucose 4-epimerase